MASFYARNGAGELLARYSFIEPLLEGKRVLEAGAACASDGGSALFLAERGAAAVLSIEPSEDRLEGARGAGHHPFVQYRASDPHELRAGAFDLVLVADGAELVRDPEGLGALQRLLAPGGRLVTALSTGGEGLAELAGEAPGAEPPPYEAFVGALADHFPLVEVATQSATVGWVLALSVEGDEEPDVAMDGTLAGTPETAAWVAICGEEPCGLAGLSIVALPVKPLLDAALESQASRGASEEERLRADGAEAARQEALAALAARAEELSQA
ncbi:MAG TPA: class I SAM-dependent methyltransferase, partial [Anaeromyxobacter sp.]